MKFKSVSDFNMFVPLTLNFFNEFDEAPSTNVYTMFFLSTATFVVGNCPLAICTSSPFNNWLKIELNDTAV